jgi:hypothetical protein
MLDIDLLYIKMYQRELWHEAAKRALVRRLTVARPPWRERWWRHFKQFLTACGLRAPALPTMRVVPAVVCTSKQRHGGSNPW